MSGRTIGILLIAVSVVVLLAAVAFMIVESTGGRLQAGGLALGVVLLLVITLPLIAVGIFLFVKGTRETADMAEVAREKRLLNMVMTQGRVSLNEAAVDLGVTRNVIKKYVYDLVGKGVFTGYVDWQDGILISQQASQMPRDKCPNCGGQLELAGKGIVQCPYCGTEIFLPQ